MTADAKPGAEPASERYRAARERTAELVQGRPESAGTEVPATPGWTVHDLVAHLAGAAEDVVAGRLPEPGRGDAWTAAQVERGQGRTVGELLDAWAAASPGVERILDAGGRGGVLLIDAGAHEQDLRAVLGEPGGAELVAHCADTLLSGLQVPQPLEVVTERRSYRLGPEEADGAVTTLTTTEFEAFRWRLGRRSRAQLAAMDWTGDPAPFLDHLYVFGPAEADLVEQPARAG